MKIKYVESRTGDAVEKVQIRPRDSSYEARCVALRNEVFCVLAGMPAGAQEVWQILGSPEYVGLFDRLQANGDFEIPRLGLAAVRWGNEVLFISYAQGSVGESERRVA